MKSHIVITGGAGFVGSNLVSYLLKKTNFKIISIDNYSTGKKKKLDKTEFLFFSTVLRPSEGFRPIGRQKNLDTDFDFNIEKTSVCKKNFFSF